MRSFLVPETVRPRSFSSCFNSATWNNSGRDSLYATEVNVCNVLVKGAIDKFIFIQTFWVVVCFRVVFINSIFDATVYL